MQLELSEMTFRLAADACEHSAENLRKRLVKELEEGMTPDGQGEELYKEAISTYTFCASVIRKGIEVEKTRKEIETAKTRGW